MRRFVSRNWRYAAELLRPLVLERLVMNAMKFTILGIAALALCTCIAAASQGMPALSSSEVSPAVASTLWGGAPANSCGDTSGKCCTNSLPDSCTGHCLTCNCGSYTCDYACTSSASFNTSPGNPAYSIGTANACGTATQKICVFNGGAWNEPNFCYCGGTPGNVVACNPSCISQGAACVVTPVQQNPMNTTGN